MSVSERSSRSGAGGVGPALPGSPDLADRADQHADAHADAHDDGPTAALLARAVGSLRDEPEPAWDTTSTRVRHALRRSTRRSRPLRATTADQPGGGAFGGDDRLLVSERVVIDLLRVAVTGTSGGAPTAIDLHVERSEQDDRCTGVGVELVAGFGTDLRAVTHELRSLVLQILDDTLGPAARVVDLRVVDVEPQDPER